MLNVNNKSWMPPDNSDPMWIINIYRTVFNSSYRCPTGFGSGIYQDKPLVSEYYILWC